MILAVDAAYHTDTALVAGILFQEWSDEQPYREVTKRVSPVNAYVPGEFYLRELPCILALLPHLEQRPEIIIIDGHVYLGADSQPGLGRHLYDALAGQVAVIGVAKSSFKGTPKATAVYRGQSKRPLYVTAAGMDEETARECIRTMPGSYRIPTLLKRVDLLSRDKAGSSL